MLPILKYELLRNMFNIIKKKKKKTRKPLLPSLKSITTSHVMNILRV